MINKGKLLIFSAPSGAGKTTIVKHILKKNLNIRFSISATSRPKRHTESHGKDYFFLSPEEFKHKIKNNAFLEWEEVYVDKFYGTLKSEVEKLLAAGHHVIFDIDVIGGLNIKKQYGDQALAIFIQPPSVEELKRRLVGRATDSKEVIESRIAKAEYELKFADKFDKIIINEVLENAIAETERIVDEFISC